MHTSFHHLPAQVQHQLQQALGLIKALAAPEKVLLLPQPASTGIDTNAAPVPYLDFLNLLVMLEKACNAQRSELQEKLEIVYSRPCWPKQNTCPATRCFILHLLNAPLP